MLAPTVFDIYGLNCYFITSDYHFKEVFKQRLTFYKLITFISRTEQLAAEGSVVWQFLTVPESNAILIWSKILPRRATSSDAFLRYFGVYIPARRSKRSGGTWRGAAFCVQLLKPAFATKGEHLEE